MDSCFKTWLGCFMYQFINDMQHVPPCVMMSSGTESKCIKLHWTWPRSLASVFSLLVCLESGKPLYAGLSRSALSWRPNAVSLRPAGDSRTGIKSLFSWGKHDNFVHFKRPPADSLDMSIHPMVRLGPWLDWASGHSGVFLCSKRSKGTLQWKRTTWKDKMHLLNDTCQTPWTVTNRILEI